MGSKKLKLCIPLGELSQDQPIHSLIRHYAAYNTRVSTSSAIAHKFLICMLISRANFPQDDHRANQLGIDKNLCEVRSAV